MSRSSSFSAAWAIAALLGAAKHGAAAADAFDATAIVGQDLTLAPVALEPGWAAGLLRVVISGPGNPAAWTIRIDYGQAGALVLDPATLRSRTVSANEQGLTVDLPILGGERVSAEAQPAGVRVRPVSVLAVSTVRSQQMIAGSDVHSIGDASSDMERSFAPAFGRLDVIDDRAGISGVCTAFRVRPGYWLTAAHCIYRDEDTVDAAPNVRWRLQPDALAGRLEGALLLDALPVASGLAEAAPTTASLLKAKDQDYAVLRVDADPGGPTLSLDDSLAATPGMALELLQYWKGEFSPPPGKAASTGAACAVRRVVSGEADPIQCSFGIQHGCSSLGGASGGALVEAAGFRLVGLHYGAGGSAKFNCAMSAAAIVSDLCTRNRTIADKVARCP